MARIVVKVEREIKQAGRNGLTVHQDVLFGQVPPARTDQQGSDLMV